MRIGFFTDRYLPQIDGIVYSIETFRTQLEALGHEVYIFAPAPGLRYKEVSKRVIRFPALKGLWGDYDYLTSLYFPPQAAKQIEKLKLDIIHFHGPGQVGLLGAYFAMRNRIPLVTTYHTDLFEYVKHYPAVLPGTIALSLLAPLITGGGMADYRTGLSSIKPERNVDKWNQKIVERGITMLHNRCDVVITPSLKMEHQLKSWHTKTRIVTLPTGVDKVTTSSREIKAVRKAYGLTTDDELILFVGRVGNEKNVKLILRSFIHLAARRPKAKLIFAGDGPVRDELEAAARDSEFSDRIIFTGFISRTKIGALYEISDVLAFPSLTDTQSLVVNEAACAGMAIVMVDPEVNGVVREGENGYYSKNTVRDFAAKLVHVLANPDDYQRMSRRSIQLADEVSPSHQAAKLLRLYEETIERHGEVIKNQ